MQADSEQSIRVAVCEDCDIASVPFFGMFIPCPHDANGSHHTLLTVMEDVETLRLARRLAAAYSAVPWFDRASFARHASPELKTLLRYGQDNPRRRY